MESGTNKNPSDWSWRSNILIIFFSAFIIYYSVMVMISPVRKMKALHEQYGKSESSKVDMRMFRDSAYLRLLKEKAFLQSRLIMAASDSVYLTVVLPDSAINLEISGVIVHKAKISSMKASKILMKGNQTVYTMFSEPFTISTAFSTIKKEPIMIKMAPRDTSEFEPDVMPDTSLTESVNYIFEAANGTRVYIYQEEGTEAGDRLTRFIFDLKYRLRNLWVSLKDVVRFKVPEYHPYIKIKLKRSDAKIIYRAIPGYGQIGISI
jgi:hypothetical protein